MNFFDHNFFLELAVIDAPYGLGQAEWDKVAWTKDQFIRTLTQLKSSSNNAQMSVCIFISIEQFKDVIEAIHETGWKHPQFVVWHKTTKPSDGGVRFTNTCEYLVWAWRTSVVKGIFRYPNKSPLTKDLWLHPHITNEAYYCTDDSQKTNPCQKPQGLLQRIVQYHSNPGGHVLDLCAGSHSLLFACLKLGRSCTSVELCERQHRSAVQRYVTKRNEVRALAEKELAAVEKGKKKAALAKKKEARRHSQESAAPSQSLGDPDVTQDFDTTEERVSGIFGTSKE